MSENHPTENSTSLSVGGEVLSVGFQVGGRMYVFTPRQTQFLMALQKLKSVVAASLSVDKPEEWGQAFLKSAKFHRYVSAKMQEFSAKNGMTVEWWYQFGQWAAEGKKTRWEAACAKCQEKQELTAWELESRRNDDLSVEMACTSCGGMMAVQEIVEPFVPSREQVVAWQELGQRLIPKIERVHHQFENVSIEFQSEEASHG